ncbi:MAG: helix-turn-helix domain-containing protein [Phycisphaeraceae bacterium]|nr:helix-turn-helix domain-containing protein [Phycisphaeraceae bacterium]MBX3367242.1 helix-turn-helix domain-containing protein [Phycisphaeraceae bacterium]
MEPNRVEPQPVALTIADAARRLAVSPMTIRRLLERGSLVRIAVGRSVRVLARSVDELAERGGVTRAK